MKRITVLMALVIGFAYPVHSATEENTAEVETSEEVQEAVSETSAPEATTPEVADSEISAPEAADSEATTPETSAPETTASEATTPEVADSETSAPEVTTPETSAPETTSEVADSETSAPEAADSEATTPEAAASTTVPQPAANFSTVIKKEWSAWDKREVPITYTNRGPEGAKNLKPYQVVYQIAGKGPWIQTGKDLVEIHVSKNMTDKGLYGTDAQGNTWRLAGRNALWVHVRK